MRRYYFIGIILSLLSAISLYNGFVLNAQGSTNASTTGDHILKESERVADEILRRAGVASENIEKFYDNTDTDSSNSTNTQESNSSDYQGGDIVLLSQKLKKGKFGYHNIVGQVKNLGNDTAEYVKIGVTTYDKDGGVLGTDYTYATANTLKPNQKSSFDMLSSKDNFNGMEYYELFLQWRNSDGTEEYVENAKIYKSQGVDPSK